MLRVRQSPGTVGAQIGRLVHAASVVAWGTVFGDRNEAYFGTVSAARIIDRRNLVVGDLIAAVIELNCASRSGDRPIGLVHEPRSDMLDSRQDTLAGARRQSVSNPWAAEGQKQERQTSQSGERRKNVPTLFQVKGAPAVKVGAGLRCSHSHFRHRHGRTPAVVGLDVSICGMDAKGTPSPRVCQADLDCSGFSSRKIALAVLDTHAPMRMRRIGNCIRGRRNPLQFIVV